mmetsp:Transcript_31237/g.57120  ORF Transcript_31237/g.57120 Transcript_31237/m.57120 type:complete len:217 (+) Transcript_31237:286-936(+)
MSRESPRESLRLRLLLRPRPRLRLPAGRRSLCLPPPLPPKPLLRPPICNFLMRDIITASGSRMSPLSSKLMMYSLSVLDSDLSASSTLCERLLFLTNSSKDSSIFSFVLRSSSRPRDVSRGLDVSLLLSLSVSRSAGDLLLSSLRTLWKSMLPPPSMRVTAALSSPSVCSMWYTAPASTSEASHLLSSMRNSFNSLPLDTMTKPSPRSSIVTLLPL